MSFQTLPTSRLKSAVFRRSEETRQMRTATVSVPLFPGSRMDSSRHVTQIRIHLVKRSWYASFPHGMNTPTVEPSSAWAGTSP